ncbi:MAG: hydrogenase maturation protease [Dehalococcoidales bacterium]|nr:hydrogenase maturation protease [Dehalococcoidales bacterium]
MTKILVLGIGNTLLGDDGAGVLAVRRAAGLIDFSDVYFKETSAAGLNLLDLIIGFDRLIVVDAVLTDKSRKGSILCIQPGDLILPENAVSIHSCGLNAALALAGKIPEARVPRQVSIIGIGIGQVDYVSEDLSPEVKAALPTAVNRLLDEIAAAV